LGDAFARAQKPFDRMLTFSKVQALPGQCGIYDAPREPTGGNSEQIQENAWLR